MSNTYNQLMSLLFNWYIFNMYWEIFMNKLKKISFYGQLTVPEKNKLYYKTKVNTDRSQVSRVV